jgi:homoserine kinase
MNDAEWAIRVPASSANLGSGFDVLGMALSLHAEIGIGPPPDGGRAGEPSHPAVVAFRRLGGQGALWIRSPIPVGRGLGFSGAMRVGGGAAAIVQRYGPDALAD